MIERDAILMCVLADAEHGPRGLLTWHSLLVGVGLVLSGIMWWRLVRRDRDPRLPLIYLGGLVGAAIGAKLAFLAAEGWMMLDDTEALLAGRSVLGGLLGGYVGVETCKRLLRYTRTTGDRFAIIVPLVLAIGRVGCFIQGCCLGRACPPSWWTLADHQGVARWPSALVEMAFNLGFFAWALAAKRRGWALGNRFHVYLMAYGAFRFVHEFMRDQARIAGPLTGYHFLALLVLGFGAWRAWRRPREVEAAASVPGA